MSAKDSKTGENGVKDNTAADVPSSQISFKAEKKDFIDIKALIRSIQRVEGAVDCFRSGITDCDQLDCKWRHICLEVGYGLK